MQSIDIPSEAAMLALGGCWAKQLHGAVVFLTGELGAGKTTLARGIVGAMGHRGAVTSPTYNLVAHYSSPAGEVFHLDLFRLEDPRELEMLGVREMLETRATLLVEWPERGGMQLPTPDFKVDIHYASNSLSTVRRVQVEAADGKTRLPEGNEK